MAGFSPLSGLVGGLMIGLSAALFLLLSGRISGISGILEGALRSPSADAWWRPVYLLGLPFGALWALWLAPEATTRPMLSGSWLLLGTAGLLVGYGARMGGGCTSGHGVCGISRLSPRSIVATAVFMGAAIVSVFLMRHVLHLGAN